MLVKEKEKKRREKRMEKENKFDEAMEDIAADLRVGDVVIDDEDRKFVVLESDPSRREATVKRVGGKLVLFINGGEGMWEEDVSKADKGDDPNYEPISFPYMVRKENLP